jgi:hypothetical protein
MFVSGEIMGAYDVSAHRLSASAYLADLDHAIALGNIFSKNGVQVFQNALPRHCNGPGP